MINYIPLYLSFSNAIQSEKAFKFLANHRPLEHKDRNEENLSSFNVALFSHLTP